MASYYKAPKYEPTPEVLSTHSIVHVNPMSGFTPVSNTFDPLNINYLYSVVTVPAIILGVGIIAILLLFIISNCFIPTTCFWKYCWYYICCCFFCPRKDQIMDVARLEDKKQELLTSTRNVMRVCYGVIFTILISACFLWLGNADLSQGMNDAITGVTMLKDLLLSLINSTAAQSGSLLSHTSNLANSLSGPDCNWMVTAMCNTTNPAIAACGSTCVSACIDIRLTLDMVSEYSTTIVSQGGSIRSLAVPIETGLDTMNAGVANAIPTKDLYVILVFIGLIVLCLLNFLAIWRKNPYFSFIVSIINYVLMIALLVACSLAMVIVMILSDFCVDPAAGLMTVAGSASDTIQFYTTCIGTNTFQRYLDSINQQLTNFADYIGDPTNQGKSTSIYNLENSLLSLDASYNMGICASSNLNCHQCSAALNPEYSAISNKVADISAYLGCEPINKMYNQLINTAFCTSSFSGVYKVWGDLYFIALFFFVLLCCISKLYQYKDMNTDVDIAMTKAWIKVTPISDPFDDPL